MMMDRHLNLKQINANTIIISIRVRKGGVINMSCVGSYEHFLFVPLLPELPTLPGGIPVRASYTGVVSFSRLSRPRGGLSARSADLKQTTNLLTMQLLSYLNPLKPY